jgi:hypothetical protein
MEPDDAAGTADGDKNETVKQIGCGRAQMMKVRLENVKVWTPKDEMEVSYWNQ